MSNIVLTDGSDFYKHIFCDIDRVISYPFNGFHKGKNCGWMGYRISHSNYTRNRLIPMWIQYVLRMSHIKNGDSVIILNNAIWSPYWDCGMITALQNKGCHVGVLMLDPISVMDSERQERMFRAASVADVVFTYDADDAKQYGWKYTNCYYSKSSAFKTEGEQTDVFCVMRNNGRLEKAIEIYDVLSGLGQKCLFYIHGVSEQEEKKYPREGIIYNRYLSYEKILNRIHNTNIILEIGKESQKGSTLRAFEAIVYNKKLLTNRKTIVECQYYSQDKIQVFSCVDDINNVPNSFWKCGDVNYQYIGDFTPRALFEFGGGKEKNYAK